MDELARKMALACESLREEALPDAAWLERAAAEFKRRREQRVRLRKLRWAALGSVAALSLGVAAERWREAGAHAVTAVVHVPVAGPAPVTALQLADGSTATPFDDRTVLRAEPSAPSAAVEVVQGGARFVIERRPTRWFRVEAGPAVVEATGSDFTVERIASQVRVAVFKGDLQVVCQGRVVHLFEGDTAMFPRAPAWQPSEHEATNAALQPATADDALPRAPRRAANTPDALLRAADAARRAHRPAHAIAPLREMVERHTRDPRAPAAAFTLGRVLMDVGQYRQAAAAFLRAATLDSGGSLSENALAREAEAWSRAGDTGRARTRAADYLQRFPDGVHVAAMRGFVRSDDAR